MTNPVIWLGLSILLLAIGLGVLVCVSVPTLIGLARAARSAEKFFDTLDRELPRTLEAMRHTGNDLRGLAGDMTDGVSSASNIVQQVDRGLSDVRQQADQAKRATRSVAAGFTAAWRVLTKPTSSRKRKKRRPPTARPEKPPETAYKPTAAPSTEKSSDSTLEPRSNSR
ncbi:MAG: DUF948 domain-containing protein [Leptolyngbyaceae cyanobacterium MAG.088]|nr:DUF948 domain-containing protein [Leptolyngbyaceae cyanobacterium MAG.088]